MQSDATMTELLHLFSRTIGQMAPRTPVPSFNMELVPYTEAICPLV